LAQLACRRHWRLPAPEKRVLLANKEALVMGGPLFMAAVRERARPAADRQRAQRHLSMHAGVC
jgi:hypothetical protein